MILNFKDEICNYIQNVDDELYNDLTDEQINDIAEATWENVAYDDELMQKLDETIMYYVNHHLASKKYIKCKIQYVDDNSQLEVIIKTDDECIESEDDKVFYYGLSLNNIRQLVKSGKVVDNEWRILKVLEVMEEME